MLTGLFGRNFGHNFATVPLTSQDENLLEETLDEINENKEEIFEKNWDEHVERITEFFNKIGEHLEEIPSHIINAVVNLLGYLSTIPTPI